MAWLRDKKYLIQQTAPTGSTYTFAVHGILYGDHAFFDFTTRKFVQTQPVQMHMSLPEMKMPLFSGNCQRFVYVLDTHDFPDGDFTIIYCDGDGAIRESCYLEPFCIFGGSPNVGPSTFA